MVFFIISNLRLEVVISSVDIGGIVDYFCFNFLFIKGEKSIEENFSDFTLYLKINCNSSQLFNLVHLFPSIGGCCCRDRMVVGFTTTYAITAYYY
jgi:hypothetical protein